MVSNRRERAQLVLIAAILVATAILGAVVLLNTIHSSPDVKAQTDAQSVQDTERITAQVQADLRSLFLATSTEEGERQRQFAEEDEFEDAVEAYEEQFVERVSSDRSAVPSVEFDDGVGVGDFVSGDELDNVVIAEDVESIPYVFMESDTSTPATFRITDLAGPDKIIDVRSNNVRYGEDTAGGPDQECAAVGTTPDGFSLTLQQGTGEVRDKGDGNVCTITLFDPGEIDGATVQIEDIPDGIDEGAFDISAGGGTTLADENEYDVRENVIVNPQFDLTYKDPNVEYESDFSLFGGGS